MSLRLKLFLGLACLVTLMVTAQWWWVRELTRDLSKEVGGVAFEVSRAMAALFAVEPENCPHGANCEREIQGEGIVVRRADEPVVMSFHSSFSTSSKISPTASTESGVTASGDTTSSNSTTVASPKTGPISKKPPRSRKISFHPHLDSERNKSWVAAKKGDPLPDWIQIPEGVESMHLISDDIARKGFKISRKVGDGEAHQIMLRLDMDEEGQGDGQGNFFFSNDASTEAGYITVLAADAGHDHFARRIPIKTQGLTEKLEDFRGRMLWGSMVIFAIGLMLSALVAQRVSAPLRRLAEAAREVGEGSLGKQVPGSTSGEVGQAIHAFNLMSSELESYDQKTRQLQAREHLGEIGEISRGLAHTLRNPLNALGLSVEELAAQAPGDADALASSARRQIRRIDHSIRSFLALASQGGGVISEVDPGELVQDVALEALQDARGRVRLDVEVEGEAPVLRAVEPELRAVLQALVVNAVEASPEGGTVSVRVSPKENGGRVGIAIEDQGPGLSQEVRQRLFTPHLTTKANGSGMGLFLAHRIATTRYDGQLELENLKVKNSPISGTRAMLEIGPRNQELSHG